MAASGEKRRKGDDEPTEASDSMSKSDIEMLLEEFKGTLTESVANAVIEKTTAASSTLLRGYDAHVTKRFATVESNLGQLNGRMDAMAKDQLEQKQELERLRLLLAAAEATGGTPSASNSSAQRDRDVFDLSLICINAQNNVALDALRARLLQHANLNDIPSTAFTVSGPVQGKFFAAKFNGEHGMAARRARKFVDALRGDGGKRNDFTLERPNGEPETLYLSPDKSTNTIRREINTKLLHSTIKDLFPNVKAIPLKMDGSISVQWQVMVSLVRGPEGMYDTLSWNSAIANDNGVVSGTVDAAFAAKLLERSRG